jgi:hypothetical protein
MPSYTYIPKEEGTALASKLPKTGKPNGNYTLKPLSVCHSENPRAF